MFVKIIKFKITFFLTNNQRKLKIYKNLNKNLEINNNPQKFLVIRISSLGDVLLTSALIRNIKKTFPDAIIDFVVDRQFEEIVKHNPHINNVIIYDKKLTVKENNRIKKNLPNDYKIIDLQNNFRSFFFRKGLGKEVAVFKKSRIKKLLLVWLKINLFGKNDLPIPEKYITVANKFGIKNSTVATNNAGLEIWLPEEKELDYYPPTIKKANFFRIKKNIFLRLHRVQNIKRSSGCLNILQNLFYC